MVGSSRLQTVQLPYMPINPSHIPPIPPPAGPSEPKDMSDMLREAVGNFYRCIYPKYGTESVMLAGMLGCAGVVEGSSADGCPSGAL